MKTLIKAVKQNKLSVNQFINIRDKDGVTALHDAVRFGSHDSNLAVVEELLKNGAEIDAQDNEGNTPLHRAVQLGHIEHVRFLLKNGANRYIRNKKNQLPGGVFTLSPSSMKEILNLLTDMH